MTKITSGIFAQGSFGLRKINPWNGTDIGRDIKIWFAHRDGVCIGAFLTRTEAREALRNIEAEYGR
jgi:hypothetical protein